MENKFLHNNQTNSLFNSAYQASNKCFKQAAITDLSIHSGVLNNTSILSKSIKMKYPTSSIQQAQNLNGYSICTASNNNNFQMKNTKFTSFVFALIAMVLMFSSKYAMASPGNKIFIDATFVGAVPGSSEMHFCEPDTFTIVATNLTSNPISSASLYFLGYARNIVSGVNDSTKNYIQYVSNVNGFPATLEAKGGATIDLGGFAANETKTIKILAFLTCDGYKARKASLVMRNAYKIFYGPDPLNDYDVTNSSNYFPMIPNLITSSISPNSILGTNGTTFARDITIVNGGFGKVKEFVVDDVHGSAVVIDSIRTGDGIVVENSGTRLRVFIDSAYLHAKYGDSLMGLNKVIIIREYVRVVACDANGASSRVNAKFGCNLQSSDFCDSTASLNASVLFGVGRPILSFKPNPSLGKCLEKQADAPQSLRIINTGAFDATDIDVKVFTAYASYMNPISLEMPYWHASRIDTSSFSIQYGSGAKVPYAPIIASNDTSVRQDGPGAGSYYYMKANSCFSGDYRNRIERGIVKIPSLKAGDTITIYFALDNCCQPDNVCNNPSGWDSWGFSALYHEPCNLYTYSQQPLGGGTAYSRAYRDFASTYPSDVNGTFGQPDSVQYQGLTGITRTYLDGTLGTVLNKGRMMEIEYTVGRGLKWDGKMPYWISRYAPNVNYPNWVADSVKIDSTPTNRTYHFYWKIDHPNISWDMNDLVTGTNTNFTFIPDCANLVANPVSVQRQDYYFPGGDSSCIGTCRMRMYVCKSPALITVHCPGCSAPALVNAGFEIKRKNFGFADADDNGIADLPLTTASANQVNLGRAMRGDTMIGASIGYIVQGGSPIQLSRGYGMIVTDSTYSYDWAGGTVDIYSFANNTTYSCNLIYKGRGAGANNHKFFFEFTPADLAANIDQSG